MLQFLRLHARQNNFGKSVVKARRFAATQEAIKPKKLVRLIEAGDRDHSAGAVPSGQTNFQPLLDGFEKIIQTVVNDTPQVALVACVNNNNDASRGGRVTRYDNRPSSPGSSNRSQCCAGSSEPQQRPSGNNNGRTGRPWSHSRPNQPQSSNSGYGDNRPNYGRNSSPSPAGRFQNTDRVVLEGGVLQSRVLPVLKVCGRIIGHLIRVDGTTQRQTHGIAISKAVDPIVLAGTMITDIIRTVAAVVRVITRVKVRGIRIKAMLCSVRVKVHLLKDRSEEPRSKTYDLGSKSESKLKHAEV